MSKSGPSANAARRVSAASRLTPRLMLPDRTIGAWRAAASIWSRSSALRPVVPITSAMRACAASPASSTLAAGEEKSTIASASSRSGSGSATIARLLAGQPASMAGSAPSQGESRRSSAPVSLSPSDSWIVLTTMRPMRPAAPLTISLIAAIQSPKASAWLRAAVTFGDDEVHRRRSVAQFRRGAMFLGVVAGERGLVVAKLDDDIARRRLARGDDMLAGADQEAGPEFGERDGVRLDVLLVDLGIVHVHAGDPVALWHRQTPSTR